MKKKISRYILRGITALLLGACLLQYVPSEDSYAAEEMMLTQDYYAEAGFSSHMPVIALDFTAGKKAENEHDYFLDARIISYEGEAANTLAQNPTVSKPVSLRNMTDRTNRSDKKNDYYFRMESGQSLAGLKPASEYLLLGAMSDKSLIRNYIGYTIAAAIDPEYIDVQLCEVFTRDADGDLYQGVYLLVGLYKNDNEILFHRNADGNGLVIENYAAFTDPDYGYMSLPIMETTQWDDRYSRPIGNLSEAESVLYSTDTKVFYSYSERFDVDSFIRSLLVGELTQNYAGLDDAYYYIDTDTQMLQAAPIWNFEKAFDNDLLAATDIDQIQYDTGIYYEHFFKSGQFTKQVQSEYLALRTNTLDETTLQRIVRDAADYVAPAVSRDWARWDDYREFGRQSDDSFSRDTDTYEAELIRIRYHLREHSLYMAGGFTQFDFNEREISKELVLNTNPVWIVMFVVVLFLLVRFARRYGV